jgi:hypothetical protein
MTKSTIKTGEYTTTIESLEKLGWEFSAHYDDTARAKEITNTEAEAFLKEKYNVVIVVSENGSTQYRFDAGSEFGDNETTGDDIQTLKDIQALIDSDKIINFQEA